MNTSRLDSPQPLPVRTQPPPAWPHFAHDEIAAATAVLESGKVNQWTGRWVHDFENQFAEMHGGRHLAVAVANGSLALECALRAMGIGPGDEVVVTSRSFVASASSVCLVGAIPVFADVDFDTQLITPETVEPLITSRTRAILPVHLHGRPCDMTGFLALAERHGLFVIEDCAQSIGASMEGRRVGTFGHAAAFSFCQDKILSTGGEGGIVLFADAAAGRRGWALKDHGKNYEKACAEHTNKGFQWVHDSIGSNWRMTGLQAAIGCCQLGKLDRWVAVRNRHARRLAERLAQYPCVSLTPLPDTSVHARYRLEFVVRPERLNAGWSRNRILSAINQEGIAMFSGPCPEIYRELAFSKNQTYPTRPNAARLGDVSLTLLTHPTIDEEYLADCELAIDRVFGAASN